MTLLGQRILVPRSGPAGVRWAAAVLRRGGTAVIAPLIEHAPPLDVGALREAAGRWNRGDFGWMAVTSPRGAAAIAEAGARPRADRRIAAVGPATADELGARGFRVDLMPARDFSGRGLADALTERLDRPTAVLLPLSELADDTVADALRAAGHAAERVDAYRTVPAGADPSLDDAVAGGRIDAILAGSGSTAREIARRFAPLPPGVRIVAMGPPTARALADSGLAADAVASSHTVEGMLDALERLVPPEPRPTGTGPDSPRTRTPDHTRDQEAHE